MAGPHQMRLGSGGGYVFKETIAAGVLNYNLKARALAAGWNGLVPLLADVVVNPGVVVGSASSSAYAFDTGVGFPAGSRIALVNNGAIVGLGGAGGAPQGAGSPGGPALRAQSPLSIANAGTIGGGGGGGGGYYDVFNDPEGSSYAYILNGGSGAGGGTTLAAATAGQSAGAAHAGNGGALGAAGATGLYTSGGAAGACVVGNANVTWVATGTRYGSVG